MNAPLHILGAPKKFADPLHVNRPNIGNRQRFLKLVEECLSRRWLSNDGPVVRQFEAALREQFQVRHVIAMTNATVAIELVLKSLGVDGRVIVPAHTFVGAVHAVYTTGNSPVFADIGIGTHNLDPADAARVAGSDPQAIMPVHLWGEPASIPAFEALASRYKIPLIFDAAHALGCTWQGRSIATFGRAAVFSFHATKFVNSGEGGAVATNDDELARRLRLMRNFGFDGYDSVVSHGTNAKMSEVSAALGLTNLECMDEFVSHNRENFEAYSSEMANLPGIFFRSYAVETSPNYQYVVVEVDSEVAGLSRDELMMVLHEENVLTRRYFYPGCHRMEPYRTLMPSVHLPRTDAACSRVMVLPSGTAIGIDAIRTIGTIFRTALEFRRVVRRTLAGRRVPGPPVPLQLPDMRRHQ